MQFAKVIGFAERVVRQFPVQPFLDRFGASVLVSVHVVRRKLWSQISQEIVWAEACFGVWVYPKHATLFYGWQFHESVTRFVYGPEMIFIRDVE